MNPRTPYILSALVAAAACHTAVPDLIPTPVAFERLPTQRLNITYPGWALISTRRRWLRLWEYYGPTDIDSLGHQAVPQVPEVDFERYQVFAYSLGIADGCRWTGELIARIEATSHHRLVIIQPDASYGIGAGCNWDVPAVDMITIPRSALPIAIYVESNEPRLRTPPPAEPWWVSPSLASILDTTTARRSSLQRQVSLRVLPRDTTLGTSVYRRLAHYAHVNNDWGIRRQLLANPKASADAAVVAWLASSWNGGGGRELQLILLQRFGLAIATNDRARREWLEALMNALLFHETGPPGRQPHEDVALALAEHPLLLRDPVLLWQVTHAVQWYPRAVARACAAWIARYPPIIRMPPDSLGRVMVLQTQCIYPQSHGARSPPNQRLLLAGRGR